MKPSFRKTVHLAFSLAALAALVTCSSDSRSPTEVVAKARSIRAISGDSQTGRALARLPEAFSVQVLDDEGHPVPAYTVHFEVTSAAGVLTGSNSRTADVVTNNNGITSAYLTLGASADIQYVVEATAASSGGQPLSGSPVRFRAQATSSVDTSATGGGGVPGSTSSYSMTGIQLGADTVGAAGRFFKIPLAVHVTDSTGQGIAGLSVFYSPYEGGGVFDIAEKTTDQNGNAANFLRLGYDTGKNLIQASAVLPDGSVLVVTWRIWAIPDPDVRHNAYNIQAVTANADSLTGTIGTTLPLPLVVAVTDTFGQGSPAQPVTWTVEHFGKLTSVVSNSNTEGVAQITFTLGPNAGLNRVTATIIRDDGNARSAYFNVYGIPPVIPTTGPDSLAVVSGNDQIAEVGKNLPLPVTLAVLDSHGDRLPSVDVKLTVTGGNGYIGQESVTVPSAGVLNLTSDADGLVVIVWQLGPGPDLDNTVVAEVRRPDGSTRSVTLHAQALPHPDTANRLIIMSGNYQGEDGSYAVGTQLPLPLVVRVVDSTRTGVNGDPLGAPISNFPVLFQAFSPSGDADVQSTAGTGPGGTGRLESLTDADGLAAVRLTLGTQTGGPDDLNVLRHNNTVVVVAVFADGSQDSVVFTTTAMPQAAAKFSATGSTDRTGTAGSSLAGLGVQVTDQYGNAVAGVGVSFTIDNSPGGGSISSPSLTTSTSGLASGTVNQLSTTAGTMKVSAASGALAGSPITFTITVNPDAAASIIVAGGDGQIAKQGTAWSIDLKVLVRDQYNNAKPNQLVTFAVAVAGSAALESSAVFTDDKGYASTKATPNIVGNVTVTATTLIGGVNKSVTFSSLTATAP